MKKPNKTLFSVLLILLLFSKNTMQTFAMETSFRLPVETVLEGDKPVNPETFVIRMRALTDDAPMPEQAKDRQAVLEISGSGKKEFPPIKFIQPGVYQYEITQQEGNGQYYTYDTSVYLVTVYCTADSDHGLETTVVALEQGKEEIKKEAVRFINRYEVPKAPSEPDRPVKTGDNAPVERALGSLLVSGCMILFFVAKKHGDKKKIEE